MRDVTVNATARRQVRQIYRLPVDGFAEMVECAYDPRLEMRSVLAYSPGEERLTRRTFCRNALS